MNRVKQIIASSLKLSYNFAFEFCKYSFSNTFLLITLQKTVNNDETLYETTSYIMLATIRLRSVIYDKKVKFEKLEKYPSDFASIL